MKLALGTAAIGRPHYINIKEEISQEAFDQKDFMQKGEAVLSAAYDLGIRHFDTAPGYGIAEEIILNWIRKTGVKDISISTKWGYTYTANFDPNAKVHEVKEHSLEKLKAQWDYSKQLLPFLKIYQIHSATIDTGVLDNEAVLKELARIKKEFNVEIALSASGANQSEIIQKAIPIKMNGEALFTAFQVTYNLLEQSLKELIQSNSDKKFIIKEALANGRILPSSGFENYASTYKILEKLARKHHVGVDAIALKFCLQSINPDSVLSGASTPKQVAQNLEALTFELSSEDLNLLYDCKIPPKDYWKERSNLAWQ